ncbi:hypothetical protein G6F32_015906 [Rhizopus arrhizus]|nr:hypothetical protein G6F32_015906 [Rhizopus arrhizus]
MGRLLGNAVSAGRMPVAGEGHWFPILRSINSRGEGAVTRAACGRRVPFQAAGRGLRSGRGAGWPAVRTGWRTPHSARRPAPLRRADRDAS